MVSGYVRAYLSRICTHVLHLHGGVELMSSEATSIALHHSKASGVTKLVLIGIANHCGDGGAYPSIATLAKYAGKSARTVQRAIDELERLGEISVARNAGGSADLRNDQRPNLYHFLLRCPDECDGTTQHRVPSKASGVTSTSPRNGVSPVSSRKADGVTSTSPRKRNGVTPVTERGDIPDANGVTQVSPELDLEPPMNSFNSPSVGVGFAAQAPPTEPSDAKPKASPKGTRLRAGWMPSERSRRRILDEFPGSTVDDLRGEHPNFEDYWLAKAGRDATKVDWDRTWCVWMRRHFTDHPPRHLRTAPNPGGKANPYAGLDHPEQEALA